MLEKFANAKHVEYTFDDGDFAVMRKAPNGWSYVCMDGNECTYFGDPVMFPTFDAVVHHLVECQKNVLKAYADEIQKFSNSVVVYWNDEKLRSIVVANLKLVR